jgi:hypothetical protein
MRSIVKKTVSVAAFLTLVGAGASQSLAQQPAAKVEAKPAPAAKAPAGGGDENTQYKAKTVFDFDADNVEGDLQRPDGELIDSVRKVKHSSLIEIRKDFIPEMLKSLEDV